VVLLKELHGLQDDLKITWKNITPGRYPVQKIFPPKNGVKGYLHFLFNLISFFTNANSAPAKKKQVTFSHTTDEYSDDSADSSDPDSEEDYSSKDSSEDRSSRVKNSLPYTRKVSLNP